MKTDTKQIGFALGRDTALSVAEIFSYLQRQEIETLGRQLIGDLLIVEIADTDTSKISINDLGGSIKLFEVLGTYTSGAETVEKLQTEIDYNTEKRVNFGVSGYGNVNKNFVLKVGYDIKNKLQESGYAARFVTGKTVDLSSVIVNENKLIERGFEAIIAKSGQEYLLGKTISVQDYKAYSKRDFGRPVRDARNGMLPPKLAQIMINLAAMPLATTLYDPFCGSGTILQEALFLGYRDIYGSDIEKKNIADTLTNMEWLYNRFGMPKIGEDKVFVSDILSPTLLSSLVTNPGISSVPSEGDPRVRKDDNVKFGAIVGEGYLGEPVRRKRNAALADTQKLAQFYISALTQMKKQLAKDGTIVLAIPFYIVDKEYFYLPLMEELPTLGLTAVNYIPNDLEIRRFGRGNLTYSREDQFVGREILVLKKR